jgi:hypothetical protein
MMVERTYQRDGREMQERGGKEGEGTNGIKDKSMGVRGENIKEIIFFERTSL